ncbi:MAG: single-stranded DNA-binding protein [Candidatus Micrarchaeia archaeon]
MFNKFIAVGNLTRDPEIRYTPSGIAVTILPIAVNTRFKSNGETKEETLFIDVVVFNKQAETCVQYLSKGKSILVEGRLRERKWEKEGVTHRKMEVIANTVKFMSPRQSEQSDTTDTTMEEIIATDIPDTEPF